MQEFTEEFKAIQKALSNCWAEKSAKGNELLRLQETRKKMFADIVLGLCSAKEKRTTNKKIRELEEDISDIDIAVKELELRHALLKKEGRHMRWVGED
ncbi:hypothetical protein ES708_13008 [subsurface metagenome]